MEINFGLSCNFGGSGHTFEWQEKYFPDIKMFHSGNFEFYNRLDKVAYNDFRGI